MTQEAKTRPVYEMPPSSFNGRWFTVSALVLATVFVVSSQALRFIFPMPHPQSYRSASLTMLSTQTQAIAIGSSHLAFGLDPAPFGGALVSLPAGAMDFSCEEAVLRRTLERAPNVRLVILEADVINLLVDSIDKSKGDFHQLYALGLTLDDLPMNGYAKLKQRAIESKLLYPIFFLKRLVPQAFVWEDAATIAARREAGDAMLRGYVPSEAVINERNDGRVVVEFHKADYKKDHSKQNEAALIQILRAMREQGRQVVLMRFPKHHSYWEYRPPEWERRYREFIDRVKSEVPDGWVEWDYDRLSLPDDQFMDGHHMNRRGAEAFTELLKPKIEALLQTPAS